MAEKSGGGGGWKCHNCSQWLPGTLPGMNICPSCKENLRRQEKSKSKATPPDKEASAEAKAPEAKESGVDPSPPALSVPPEGRTGDQPGDVGATAGAPDGDATPLPSAQAAPPTPPAPSRGHDTRTDSASSKADRAPSDSSTGDDSATPTPPPSVEAMAGSGVQLPAPERYETPAEETGWGSDHSGKDDEFFDAPEDTKLKDGADPKHEIERDGVKKKGEQERGEKPKEGLEQQQEHAKEKNLQPTLVAKDPLREGEGEGDPEGNSANGGAVGGSGITGSTINPTTTIPSTTTISSTITTSLPIPATTITTTCVTGSIPSITINTSSPVPTIAMCTLTSGTGETTGVS